MDGTDFNDAWHDLYDPVGEKNMHKNDGSSELFFSPSPTNLLPNIPSLWKTKISVALVADWFSIFLHEFQW